MVEVRDNAAPVWPHGSNLLTAGLSLGVMACLAAVVWTPYTLVANIAAIVTTAMLAVHFERHWARPARGLRRLLKAIHDGEAAVCELDDYVGRFGLSALIPDVQHSLRDRKEKIARTEQEVDRRVASRTNALERRLQSLRTIADRDALTTLKNRSAFDRTFEPLVETCLEHERRLCCVMVDFDHFKLVNDTLGHARGDELLSEVGRLIAGSVRDEDFAFRYGGDAFVLLLPGRSAAQARRLLERLAALVDALVKPMKLGTPPRLSFGISELQNEQLPDAAALLHKADSRLYQAKQSRRIKRAA